MQIDLIFVFFVVIALELKYWKSDCLTSMSESKLPSQDVHSPQTLVNTDNIALPEHYFRSSLARSIYFKLKEDEQEKNNRHIYWYRVIVCRFTEADQQKFVQLEQDQETDEFLQISTDKSNELFTQLFYSLVRPVLSVFMSQTQINGFLNRGSMFIFSKLQFEKLLKYTPYYRGDKLLDLGAGDGMVTKQMSRYFNKVYVTELSSYMVRRLQTHGFQVVGVNEWQSFGMRYDLISCLNLLDRCNNPLSLLKQIKDSLVPITGRVLLAVVIPFKPYVEFESPDHKPNEILHVKGSNFEEQVQHFLTIFEQFGFEVESFTRLPYLCEGDMRHSFYVLTDAVFVLKVKD